MHLIVQHSNDPVFKYHLARRIVHFEDSTILFQESSLIWNVQNCTRESPRNTTRCYAHTATNPNSIFRKAIPHGWFCRGFLFCAFARLFVFSKWPGLFRTPRQRGCPPLGLRGQLRWRRHSLNLGSSASPSPHHLRRSLLAGEPQTTRAPQNAALAAHRWEKSDWS